MIRQRFASHSSPSCSRSVSFIFLFPVFFALFLLPASSCLIVLCSLPAPTSFSPFLPPFQIPQKPILTEWRLAYEIITRQMIKHGESIMNERGAMLSVPFLLPASSSQLVLCSLHASIFTSLLAFLFLPYVPLCYPPTFFVSLTLYLVLVV